MNVYTYSEARQNLAQLLEKALASGEVAIRRRDGTTFVVRPSRPPKSPLDVGFVKTSITAQDVLEAIQAGRDRSLDS
jgi:hypothetical protein